MRRLLSAVLALTLAVPAFATEPAKPSADNSTPPAATSTPPTTFAPANSEIGKLVDPNTLPALRNVLKKSTAVRYMGNEYGLKAYFVTNNRVSQIVYMTPDEQGFLLGSVFAGDGTPTTLLQLGRLKQAGFDVDSYINDMADYANGVKPMPPAELDGPASSVAGPAPTVKASPGDILLGEMNKASWIGYGPTSAPMIVAFMDPDCGVCHTTFNALFPLTQQNKIYLRVVPAGVITKDSMGHAVSIMASSNPSDAWVQAMAGKAPALADSETAGKAIADNSALFWKWKLPGTPYMAYRATSGEVKVIYGEPEDMKALLADLGVK